MKSSSARTLEVPPDGFADSQILIGFGENAPSLASATGLVHDFTRFDSLATIRPQTVRMAGRLNAASISETEHKGLLKERQRLLDKKFNGDITKQESNRLEYVRWSLDRIEDAKYGSALDTLEASIATYENFLSELQTLDRKIRQPRQSKR